MDRMSTPSRSSGLQPGSALAVVATALLVSTAVAGRYSPAPSNVGTLVWYKALRKPSYSPPDPLFGVIWPVLASVLSLGAWRLLRHRPTGARNQALLLWAANLCLMTAYGVLTFGRHSFRNGLGVGLALLGSSFAYLTRAASVDRFAAWAGVPFAIWSGFGTWLTWGVLRRNRQLAG